MFIKDPKTNEKSVSLSILVYSIVILSILGILEACEVVKSTGPFLELTYSSIALYFGRRFQFKNQSFSDESGSAKDIEQKVEELNK